MELIPYHRPVLKAGEYRIALEQQVMIRSACQGPYKTERLFAVRGERFVLQEDVIRSRFPPPNGRGDYADCLPHIAFDRSTYPWERSAGGVGSDLAWLALLLLDETEMGLVEIGGVELRGLARGPGWRLETGERETDTCRVLRIPPKLLETVAPSADDLRWLAHVRRTDKTDRAADASTDGQTTLSVLVCNRLPPAGKSSRVLLVSLEGYYDPRRADWYPATPKRAPAQNGGDDRQWVELVLLHDWSFATDDRDAGFESTASQLDIATLKIPLRSGQETLDALLASGFSLLPYRNRAGDDLHAWYRGPLIPCRPHHLPEPSTQDAKTLIRPIQGTGMSDVSYAAAWQFGYLLLLRNMDIALKLQQWRRDDRRRGIVEQQQADLLKALGTGATPSDRQDPATAPDGLKELAGWFGRLSRLEWLPFYYLVPDERMLPQESIRFFRLDGNWLRCLIDGALRIGRPGASDADRERKLTEKLFGASGPWSSPMTGVLIRSRLIADWPALEVSASAKGQPLKLFATRRPADDILFCLFRGELDRVELGEPPEGLHFAFGRSGEVHCVPRTDTKNVPFKQPEQDRHVVDIDGLATGLTLANSAELAAQLIRSATTVSFAIDPEGTAHG